MVFGKSNAAETQPLLAAHSGAAAASAAEAVPPPSSDYGTTSPPRSDSPPAVRHKGDRRIGQRGSERRPGLEASAEDDDDDNDDSAADESEAVPSPAERHRRILRFVLVWSTIAAATVYLIVEAFRRGGGEFDWKGALKKAAGGGVAGAMAMVVQVLTLMPLRTIMKCVSVRVVCTSNPAFFPHGFRRHR